MVMTCHQGLPVVVVVVVSLVTCYQNLLHLEYRIMCIRETDHEDMPFLLLTGMIVQDNVRRGAGWFPRVRS